MSGVWPRGVKGKEWEKRASSGRGCGLSVGGGGEGVEARRRDWQK